MQRFLVRRLVLGTMAVVAMALPPACSTPPTAPTTASATAPAPSTAVAPAPTAPAVVAADAPATTRPTSQVIAGPANLRNFNPKETAISSPVPAAEIDLRKIFEDLGPDATRWYQHVQTLANPFFEGRWPSSHGGDLAAEYIEFYFRQTGLEPAFPSEIMISDSTASKEFKSFRQPFDFKSPSPDVRVLQAGVSINDQSLVEDTDFTVLGISGDGQVTAPVTFVGYGIDKGRDDYTSFEESSDLTGRIALVMRYEPLNEEGKSQWSATRFSRFAGLAPKFQALVDRHAAGIILVNPSGAVDGKKGLETITESARFGKRHAVPVVQMTPDAAERLFQLGDPQKRSFSSWQTLADAGEIKTAKLDDSLQVTLSASLHVNDRLKTQNIAAVLRGKGELADQWLVIGAHFDHVGFGYTGARQQNIGKLHPGADDNASGTAALLIAAERLSRDYASSSTGANLRSVVFIAFGAEESGLLGSKHFVEHSPIDAKSISLMINMDMVGRLRENKLLVQGTGTAEGLATLLKPLFEKSGMTIALTGGGGGPSDHATFYGAGMPVLFLFTGEHKDYHQPTDLAHTVNPAGATKVIDLLEAIAMEVAARPELLKFIKATGGGSSSPRDTTAKVRFGIMPDYGAELETGIKVDSVAHSTSAADAGITAGDILLTWNGEELAGGQKLAEFLGKAKPGDVVKITLLRGDNEMSVEVTLKAREPSE